MKNMELAELLNLKRRSVIFHRLKKVFSSYQLKSREFLGRKKYLTSVEGEEAEKQNHFHALPAHATVTTFSGKWRKKLSIISQPLLHGRRKF